MKVQFPGFNVMAEAKQTAQALSLRNVILSVALVMTVINALSEITNSAWDVYPGDDTSVSAVSSEGSAYLGSPSNASLVSWSANSPLGNPTAQRVWISMAVCYGNNTRFFGKRRFPYTLAAQLSSKLWHEKTDHEVNETKNMLFFSQ